MKEQLTKLGKGALIYGVGQGLSKLIGFLLLPLLTAYLSPSEYGVISILSIISFLVAPVFGLGLGNSIGIVYFGDPSPTKKEETIWTSFVLLLVTSGVLLLVVFAFPKQISFLAFQTQEYGDLIKIVAVSTIFNGIINQPFVFRLQFEEKSKRYVTITAICTLVTLALTILMVVIFKNGVIGFMLATLLGNVITFTCYFLAIVRWTRVLINRNVIRQLIQYGLPMIPSFFFLFILQNSGRYILQIYHGVSDVGIYSIGNTFGLVVNLAVTAFTTAWFPYFNSFFPKQEEAKTVFGKISFYYTLGLGSVCLLLFIFAKPMVMILTGQSFHAAYKVVGIISLGYFLVGLFSILTAGVYFKKKVYLVNYVQMGAAIICIALNFILIPPMGMVGAGLAFMIGNCCLVLFQSLLNRRLGMLEVKYEWKRFYNFILAGIPMAIVSLIPRDFTLVQELIFCSALSVILLFIVFKQLFRNEKETFLKVIRDRNLKFFFF